MTKCIFNTKYHSYIWYVACNGFNIPENDSVTVAFFFNVKIIACELDLRFYFCTVGLCCYSDLLLSTGDWIELHVIVTVECT